MADAKNVAETFEETACCAQPESAVRLISHLQSRDGRRRYFHSVLKRAPHVQPHLRNFRDLSGHIRYNVDGPQLGKTRVFIETYQPVDHFSRTITTSSSLRDWLPQ